MVLFEQTNQKNVMVYLLISYFELFMENAFFTLQPYRLFVESLEIYVRTFLEKCWSAQIFPQELTLNIVIKPSFRAMNQRYGLCVR